jgi:hypothetical protein
MAGRSFTCRKSEHRAVSLLFHDSDNPHISSMPKRKRETEWEVIRIKATPAAFVGFVNAPDEATVLKAAIKQFNIRREDQSRLVVRPR